MVVWQLGTARARLNNSKKRNSISKPLQLHKELDGMIIKNNASRTKSSNHFFEWHLECPFNLFFLSGFSFTDIEDSQDSRGREGNHLLFHSTTSNRSRTFRYLFGTLHVRWLSHIFNRIACIYQTATRWYLPPYRITIWLIDDVALSFVCLRDHLILDFLLRQFETGNRWIELASTITLVLQANRLTNSQFWCKIVEKCNKTNSRHWKTRGHCYYTKNVVEYVTRMSNWKAPESGEV